MDAAAGRPERDAALDDTERDNRRRRVDADMVIAVTCDEEPDVDADWREWSRYVDEVTGIPLPTIAVEAAMKEDMAEYDKHEVAREVLLRDVEAQGIKPVSARWRIHKGGRREPQHQGEADRAGDAVETAVLAGGLRRNASPLGLPGNVQQGAYAAARNKRTAQIAHPGQPQGFLSL